MGETAVDFELEGNGAPQGLHRWEITVVRAPDLVGRKEMMRRSILSGSSLMRSRLAGCSISCRRRDVGISGSGVLFWACSSTVGGDRGEEAAAIKPECTPILF